MMNDSTRISDLPQPIMEQQNSSDTSNTYKALNIHSNPFGNGNNAINELQPYPRQEKKQELEIERQRLPSRDIEMNVNTYTQDEEITANFIPKPKNIKDYIKEHEKDEEERIINHKKEKDQKKNIYDVFTKFQEVLLIAILYFIFQMSIINRILRKHLTFLQIYDADGNFNLRGMIFKSVSFAVTFGFIFNIGDKLFTL